MSTTKIIALLAVALLGCGTSTPEPAWSEVTCDFEGLCFGQIAGFDSLVRVVSADLVELDVQPPCEPSLPPSFEVACDQVRCYAVADGWAAPFECDASPGDVDWPAWMCDGEAPSIGLDAWDEAGCANSLSTSCLAISGSATFEVWPACALDQIAG